MRGGGHAGMSGDEHAEIEEQPAVAVLREPGELLEARHGQARLLERLDQRVGQPLGELVQRDEAAGGATASGSGMRPRVAQAHTVELEPPGPDLLQPLQHQLQERIEG